MINLCLVVIATQFSETKKREMERMRLERARYHSTSTLASTSASESASCYRQIIKYIAHLWRRSKRRLLRRYRAYRSRKRQERMAQQHRMRQQRKSRTKDSDNKGSSRSHRSAKRICPKHGPKMMTDNSSPAALRVPSVSSQVALRLNDGHHSPADSPLLQLVQPQLRSVPFLSPRGKAS